MPPDFRVCVVLLVKQIPHEEPVGQGRYNPTGQHRQRKARPVHHVQGPPSTWHSLAIIRQRPIIRSADHVSKRFARIALRLADNQPRIVASSARRYAGIKRNGRHRGRAATRIERFASLTFLSATHDSPHTAIYRWASSSTCRSTAHYYRKAFPSHRCPYRFRSFSP